MPNTYDPARVIADFDATCVIRTHRLALPLLSFNPSLMSDGIRTRLVFRYGRFGSRIYQCELSEKDWSVGMAWPLELDHPLALSGCEDPRVFHDQGRWHIAFCGVESVGGTTGEGVNCHQLVARLDKDGVRAEQVYEPRGLPWNKYEKNWGFFSCRRHLYSVYTICPHVVLQHISGHACELPRVEWSPRWCGGHLRGGAPPVYHDGEFYSFFHGALQHPGWPQRTYSMGCYVFEARPPFRPLRYTPVPILLPPKEGWPRDLGVSVVFPGGAMRRRDRWIVAYGVHDSFCHIAEINATLLERQMVRA